MQCYTGAYGPQEFDKIFAFLISSYADKSSRSRYEHHSCPCHR